MWFSETSEVIARTKLYALKKIARYDLNKCYTLVKVTDGQTE
jgi:hypothetical protein